MFFAYRIRKLVKDNGDALTVFNSVVASLRSDLSIRRKFRKGGHRGRGGPLPWERRERIDVSTIQKAKKALRARGPLECKRVALELIKLQASHSRPLTGGDVAKVVGAILEELNLFRGEIVQLHEQVRVAPLFDMRELEKRLDLQIKQLKERQTWRATLTEAGQEVRRRYDADLKLPPAQRWYKSLRKASDAFFAEYEFAEDPQTTKDSFYENVKKA
jgi:hypothetical protein